MSRAFEIYMKRHQATAGRNHFYSMQIYRFSNVEDYSPVTALPTAIHRLPRRVVEAGPKAAKSCEKYAMDNDRRFDNSEDPAMKKGAARE
jgi:hypothetical protein